MASHVDVHDDGHIDHGNNEMDLDETEVEVAESANENIAVTDETTNPNEDDPFVEKSQKRALWWNDLVVVKLENGEQKAQCKHCNIQLTYRKGGPTTHLSRHLNEYCPIRLSNMRKQSKLNFIPVDSIGNGCGITAIPPIVDGKFDMLRMREIVSHWILMHEHPFSILEEEGYNLMMKSAQTEWRKISRNTGKSDCFKVYEQGKKRLKTT